MCLVAAAVAGQAGLGWSRLILIYPAVQVVRRIPLTPGGVGLIEAGMLVAAGCPEPVAAAVVLVYRLASFWLILPLGVVGYLTLRKTVAPAVPQTPSPGIAR